MIRILSVLALATLLALGSGVPHRKLRAEDDDVVLRLYTRQNPSEYQILEPGDYDNLVESNFNLSKPVKFFSNGRLSTWDTPEVVEAFLAAGDYNVILVDWSKINYSTNESYLIESAQQTGHFVSGFIDWISMMGFPFSDIHIIGFSIGCHAAAYQARYCQNGVVEYLTGLDPAISAYELGGDHLNINDAKYVEVIHTSYGGGNSFAEPLGDADFYPNGGDVQPGCETGLCSHMRSVELFVESIVSDQFVAKNCNNFEETVNNTCNGTERVLMGGTGSAKELSGIYYLTTNGESPFAQGDI